MYMESGTNEEPKDVERLIWKTRAMRSFDQQFLQIPYMNNEFGQRSFNYCSPKIWNEIPAIIEASAIVATFKRRVKSYFLSQLATQ